MLTRLRQSVRFFLTGVRLRRAGIAFEGRVRCFELPTHFKRGEGGVFRIGKDLRCNGWRLRNHLTCGPGAELIIGDEVKMSGGIYIHAYKSIAIGSYSRLAPEVKIFDSGSHYAHEDSEIKVAPIKIGRNVWLQWGCIVLPGTEIGDHSIVGPLTVVKGKFPARSIIDGNPCRVSGQVRCSDDWIRR